MTAPAFLPGVFTADVWARPYPDDCPTLRPPWKAPEAGVEMTRATEDSARADASPRRGVEAGAEAPRRGVCPYPDDWTTTRPGRPLDAERPCPVAAAPVPRSPLRPPRPVTGRTEEVVAPGVEG